MAIHIRSLAELGAAPAPPQSGALPRSGSRAHAKRRSRNRSAIPAEQQLSAAHGFVHPAPVPLLLPALDGDVHLFVRDVHFLRASRRHRPPRNSISYRRKVLQLSRAVSLLSTRPACCARGGTRDAGRNEQEQRSCRLQSERHQSVSPCRAVVACRHGTGGGDGRTRRHLFAVREPAPGRTAKSNKRPPRADLYAAAALDIWREFENL